MAGRRSGDIIISLDVGTTKICVLVAEVVEQNQMRILGIGKAPSDGLKKGVVVDVGRTITSIKAAVQEAYIMTGIPIERALVGISGGHIHALHSTGVVPIKGGVIKQSDIAAVLASARAVPMDQGLHILHVMPQYFIIDSRDRVTNPLGMHGVRLEVHAHVITGAIASVHNLVTCCVQAGVQVSDIVLEQIASAYAVLSPDEIQLGVALLDIGGGTTDMAVYQQGAIVHTMVLPVAGNHFTNDVAVGLRTTLAGAEQIKQEHGLASIALMEQNDLLHVPSVEGGKQNLIYKADLVHILQARTQEIFYLIAQEVEKHSLRSNMSAGLVLTGGGALLTGMPYVAQEILDVPVRIGLPRGVSGISGLENPMYATGYGLLQYALKQRHELGLSDDQDTLVKKIFSRMKTWVADFF